MKQTINMRQLYGSELYARSKASALAPLISFTASIIILDFGGVAFVSRSFADELCGILEGNLNVRCEQMSPEVEEMISKVTLSRRSERERGKSNAKFYDFTNMESLSRFMLS